MDLCLAMGMGAINKDYYYDYLYRDRRGDHSSLAPSP